jgi:hypothetical protein
MTIGHARGFVGRLREQLQQRSADPQLTDELDALVGQTLDQL